MKFLARAALDLRRCVCVLAVLGVGFASLSARPLQASIVTYTLSNYGSDNLHVEVQVNDNTSGLLSFVVSILPNLSLPNTGDLFGVFLEFSPHPSLSTSTSFVGADITAVALNSISGTGGNNLNGTIAGLVPGGTFDAALTLGSSGSSSGLLTTSSFTLDDNGGAILLGHIVGIGVRAQTVGLPPDGGGGSSKLYGIDGVTTIEDPPAMPEPASALIWLLLTAVFACGRPVKTASAAL
ncbi:MAG: hypothetical protein WD669_03280 [Pirellulales bacterium]